MDSVEDLLKDLTSKLGTIASEFGSRADRIIAVSGGTGATGAMASPAEPFDPVSHARQILAVRKARRKYFPGDLFHEPAWEMLMSLFIIYRDEHSMNVKQLVSCSDAPATTSQRWIDHLHKSGLIDRVTDTIDRRRIDVSLSDRGYDAMLRYLTDVGLPNKP